MEDPRLWIEPLVVFFCAVSSGLTSFGDAIMLHVVFVILGGAGAVPYEIPRVTFLATLLAATAVWLMLASAWKEVSLHSLTLSLAVVVPGVTMASIMTQVLLEIGDTRPIEIAMGSVFLAFAIWRLTVMIGFAPVVVGRPPSSPPELADGAALQSPQAPGTPLPEKSAATSRALVGNGHIAGRSSMAIGELPALAPPERDGDGADCDKFAEAPSDSAAATAQDERGAGRATPPRADDGSATAAPAALAAAGCGEEQALDVPPPPTGSEPETRSCAHRFACRRHAVPVWHELVAFLLAGTVAGVLGGLTGANGPPLMAVFAVLGTHKDRVRAVYVWYSMSELIVRLSVFGAEGQAVTEQFSGGSIAVICSVACAGFVAGTLLRRFFDTVAILKGLLSLVLVSACLQLGVLKDSVIAAGVLSPLAVWVVGLIVARTWKRRRARKAAQVQSPPKSELSPAADASQASARV
ncbi:hypothetical protein FNF27_04531 [Cafeteria roenbergensis]|uniref:Uncharacterized protein n=1 Tax=Cafeteria roenbergensis TaxID=33653 RepID=A0A5A8EDE2_CAFRO|nr:hypothetical protein FNF27_04531 [Cafeteria roenbergensis]